MLDKGMLHLFGERYALRVVERFGVKSTKLHYT